MAIWWQSQNWEPDALISYTALGIVPGLAGSEGERENKNREIVQKYFVSSILENGSKLECEAI